MTSILTRKNKKFRNLEKYNIEKLKCIDCEKYLNETTLSDNTKRKHRVVTNREDEVVNNKKKTI